jgi:hypothetical protein
MEDVKYPKQLDYQPIGRWRPGRSLKGLLDGYNGETKTGHLLAKLHDQRKIWQKPLILFWLKMAAGGKERDWELQNEIILSILI